MSNYRKLEIWVDACDFAALVYANFSGLKDYGFKDQITRSAVSVASNIAEGAERDSDVEFARYLRIAKGSCAECRTRLIIAHRTGYLHANKLDELESQATSLNKRMGALIRYLKSK